MTGVLTIEGGGVAQAQAGGLMQATQPEAA